MSAGEILVPLEEKPALAALMHDHVAEMDRIIGIGSAKRDYPHFDLYWTESDARWPFWLKVDGANTGFALVRKDVRVGRMEMAEFFVATPFRRRGIGIAAARRLIGRYTGPWRITQRENNVAAIAFWHRVLDGFVGYRETTTGTDTGRREQHFTVP